MVNGSLALLYSYVLQMPLKAALHFSKIRLKTVKEMYHGEDA